MAAFIKRARAEEHQARCKKDGTAPTSTQLGNALFCINALRSMDDKFGFRGGRREEEGAFFSNFG